MHKQSAFDKRLDGIIGYTQDIFYGFAKHQPFLDHLDYDGDDYTWWDTYHLPNTVYRLYLWIEVMDIDEGENANVWISVFPDVDPDYREEHADFYMIEKGQYKFKMQVKDFDVTDSTDLTGNMMDELEKGLDIAMRSLQVNCQKVLTQIDTELVDGATDFSAHAWMDEDWVDAETTIEFAGFDYSDIPELINFLGDDIFLKYAPEEIKELFIF